MRGATQNGFSLLEMMVVMAIIGVLSTLAVPQYEQYKARATQVEARQNLRAIFTLQETYFSENGSYGSIPFGQMGAGTCNPNPIGFQPNDCARMRYRYFVNAVPPPTPSYTAIATAAELLPSCPTVTDTWWTDMSGSVQPSDQGGVEAVVTNQIWLDRNGC